MPINNVTLVGHLGDNAEVQATSNGNKLAILNLKVASPAGRSGNTNIKDAGLVVCVTYSTKLADSLEQSAKKGQLVGIEGRLLSRKSKDENGNHRNITEVEINNIEYL